MHPKRDEQRMRTCVTGCRYPESPGGGQNWVWLVPGHPGTFGATEEMPALLELLLEAEKWKYPGFSLHQNLLLAELCRSPAAVQLGGSCPWDQASWWGARRGLTSRTSQSSRHWRSTGLHPWNQRCTWHLSRSVVRGEETNFYSCSDWLFGPIILLLFPWLKCCVFFFLPILYVTFLSSECYLAIELDLN